jgi:MFS family permease
VSDSEAGERAGSGGSRRALAVVVGVVFLDLVGFGIVIPVLPFYVRSFGVSDVYIGLLAASYSIAQFVAAPVLGRLSDAHGRRPVIVLTLVGSAVAWTVFGVAGQVGGTLGAAAGVTTLFASRLLAGAMGGNLSVAQAYVADVTPRERRAGALGLLAASFSLGFVFGPAIGGVAASEAVVAAARDLLPAVVPADEFSLPSFAAALMSLVSFAFAAAFLVEPPRAVSSAVTSPGSGLRAAFAVALRDPTLRGLTLAFFLVSVAFSGVQVMFVPFAADFYDYGATETAAFLTYIGVLGAINQGVLVGRLSRVVAPARLALVGTGFLAAALALLPFSPAVGALLPPVGGPAWVTGALVVLVVDGALLSFGLGLLNVSLSTLVSTSASDATQGSAFGVTQGAGSLGRTVGPPLMAAMYVVAFWSPFVAGAVLLVPIAGVILGVARGDRRAAAA